MGYMGVIKGLHRGYMGVIKGLHRGYMGVIKVSKFWSFFGCLSTARNI